MSKRSLDEFAREVEAFGQPCLGTSHESHGREVAERSDYVSLTGFDAVDGAPSAASKCHRVVASKRTT
ncbi:MAG TPA: hypothetical protein VKN18_14885 [Blastocatellia bacterium]|nr:hypothetical protein [Blastocatellia bacterium]